MLRDLINLENHPLCLTEIVYEWCSVICENHQILGDWENLLLSCLEICFRHLDPRSPLTEAKLSHTEHHRRLINVVFGSRKSEAIADLLHAWTARDCSSTSAHTLLGPCAEHLVGLHHLVLFSPRLRRLVIRSVELVGYEGFEEVEVNRFIEMLNHLRVTVEDMDREPRWANLLLDTVQFSEGARHLSHRYWELLVELAIFVSRRLRYILQIAYSPQVITFLIEAQEWSKLECWMGTVWMVWPPGAGGMTEEEFECSMALLFRQRPGAAQKLEQWMERWSRQLSNDTPESFQRICKRAHEAAQQGTP